MNEINKKDQVLNYVKRNSFSNFRGKVFVTAYQISHIFNISRSESSRILNQLEKEGKLKKEKGRPVKYYLSNIFYSDLEHKKDVFCRLIGYQFSLRKTINLCKAAVSYPPNGLNILITGETGVGKSFFAEILGEYANSLRQVNKEVITFNCSSYANNPELLLSIIFGHCKGAYTGAYSDNPGLVEIADGGVLFLDEVHSLPPEGQEMLFTLIDKGVYKRLGETRNNRKANVLLIMATTESPEDNFLKTFLRRIPVCVNLPSFRDRNIMEKYSLIIAFFIKELRKLNICKTVRISKEVVNALIWYDWPGNVGELENEIKIICSKLYAKRNEELGYIDIGLRKLSKELVNNYKRIKQYQLRNDNFPIEINMYNYDDLMDMDVFQMIFLASIRVDDQKNITYEELINKVSNNINNFISKWKDMKLKEVLRKAYRDYSYLIDQIEKHLDINKVYYEEYILLLLHVVLQKGIGNQVWNIFDDSDGLYQYVKDGMNLDYKLVNEIIEIFEYQYGLELDDEGRILFLIILNQIGNIKMEKYMIFAVSDSEDSTESKIIPLVKRLTRARNIQNLNILDCDGLIHIANKVNEKVSYPYIGSIIYLSPHMAIKIIQEELEKVIDKPFRIIDSNLTTSKAILAINKTNQISENNSLEKIANELKNVDSVIIKQGNISKSINVFIASFYETEPVLSRIINNFENIKSIIGITNDIEVNIMVLTIYRMSILELYKKLNNNVLVFDLIGIKEPIEGIKYFKFYEMFLIDGNLLKRDKEFDSLSMPLIDKVLENVDEVLLDSFLTLVSVDKGKEIFVEFIKYLEKSNFQINLSNKVEKLYISFLLMLERCYAGIPIDKHPYEDKLELNKDTMTIVNNALKHTTNKYPFKYSNGEIIQLTSIILS